VDASAECRIDCRAELEGQCESELKGKCEIACEEPEGALFCDGQYVDHGDNLKNCIAALNAVLKVNVKASGSADADCSGNSCEANAEGKVSSSCATSALLGAHGGGGSQGWGALGVLGLAWLARRKR
jgi:hypothetical protein